MAGEGGFDWGALLGGVAGLGRLFGGGRSPHQLARKIQRAGAAVRAQQVAVQAASTPYQTPLPSSPIYPSAGPNVYAFPQSPVTINLPPLPTPQTGGGTGVPPRPSTPTAGSSPWALGGTLWDTLYNLALGGSVIAAQILQWVHPGAGAAAHRAVGPASAGSSGSSGPQDIGAAMGLGAGGVGPTLGDVGVAQYLGGTPTGEPLNIIGGAVMPSVSTGSIWSSLASGALTALSSIAGGGGPLAMPGGAPIFSIGGGAANVPATTTGQTLFGTGTRARGSSVVVMNGRAYRALGSPIAWSGDVAAVRRLKRAAKRINRVIPHRRSYGGHRRRFR